jgi:hypothetical protein
VFERLDSRVAKALRRQVSTTPQNAKPGSEISLRISQQELADLVGSTRESVNKLLHLWQKAGIVQLGMRLIVIPDIAVIEAMTRINPASARQRGLSPARLECRLNGREQRFLGPCTPSDFLQFLCAKFAGRALLGNGCCFFRLRIRLRRFFRLARAHRGSPRYRCPVARSGWAIMPRGSGTRRRSRFVRPR